MGTHYRGSRTEVSALDAFIKLTRAANTLRGRLEAELARADLTESQFGVLEMLLHLGPLRQCDIGEKLLVSRANVTLVVDRLVSRGWVRRERHPQDRRSNVVRLTPDGRRRIVRLFPDHVRRVVDALSPLSPAEQEELGRLCRAVGRRAGGLPPNERPKPEGPPSTGRRGRPGVRHHARHKLPPEWRDSGQLPVHPGGQVRHRSWPSPTLSPR
jgi:MarR family 2-MHQ and catechol resistance regulon transcriptional repressor